MSSTDFSDAEVLLELREKDRHILAAIQQGYDNVRALNKELAYSRDEINYSLKQKLALDDLITLQTRESPPELQTRQRCRTRRRVRGRHRGRH